MRNKILAALGLLAVVALIYFFFLPVFAGRIVLTQAISLGAFELRLYGVAMALAVLSGYWVVRLNSWRHGLAKEEVDRFAFWLIIASAVCARLYFVAAEAGYYSENPGEIIQVWNGGLSIFGAILGGLAFMWFYSRKKIYSFWQLADLVALGFPLGHAIGRLGNFFNYEAYGKPTDLPWKMFVPEQFRLADAAFYHPTFLYEALGSLAIFFVLLKLRGKQRPGSIALAYLVMYGLLRTVVETLRLDSTVVFGLKLDLGVAGAIFLVASALLIARRKPAV